MEKDIIKQFIMKIPFFKKFTDHELTKLIGREKVFKDCRSGDYIFKEGDDGSSLYVVLLGSIDLVKKGSGGAESIIVQLKKGAVFGEVAMLTGNKRNLDARATSAKVVVMEFTRQLIDRMIPSVQTKFEKQLLIIMAESMDKMNTRYEQMESKLSLKK
jgi:CRP-like cAMP-binding protein